MRENLIRELRPNVFAHLEKVCTYISGSAAFDLVPWRGSRLELSKFVWLACAWRRMGRLFHAANCRCFLHFFSLPFVKSCGERQTFLVKARQTQRRGGIFFLSLSQLECSLFRPSSKQLTWPNKYFTNTFSRLHNFRWLISQQRGSRPTLSTGRARAPPSFLPSLSKWNIGTHGAFAPRRERAIKKVAFGGTTVGGD